MEWTNWVTIHSDTNAITVHTVHQQLTKFSAKEPVRSTIIERFPPLHRLLPAQQLPCLGR